MKVRVEAAVQDRNKHEHETTSVTCGVESKWYIGQPHSGQLQ